MNRKTYTITLIALVLLFVPVPVFPSKLDWEGLSFAPLAFWLFLLAKLIFGTLAGWSNDGFFPALGLYIGAMITVQILIWGALALVICRLLGRWATDPRNARLGRVVRISLLCLPLALSTIPLARVEEDQPNNMPQHRNIWQVLWSGFTRHRDREEYHRAMYDLPSNARALAMQGNYADAEPLYRKILELERKHERIQYGAERYSTTRRLVELAWILHAQGKHTEDESAMREAVKIMKAQLDDSDRNSLRYYQNIQEDLAELLGVDAKHDEAEEILRAILEQNKRLAAESDRDWVKEHRKKPLGPIDLDVVHSLNHLARELSRQGDYAGAEALAREALAMSDVIEADENDSRWGNTQSARLNVLITLASILRDQENYAEADPIFEQLLETHDDVLGWDLLGKSLSGYAESLRRQGQFTKALPIAVRALEFSEKWPLFGHPALADSLDTLAGIHAALGNTHDAESFAARAVKTRGHNR
jgi:tetratricopeptide (TPR) repeat protein